jgi:hypothetical protein
MAINLCTNLIAIFRLSANVLAIMVKVFVVQFVGVHSLIYSNKFQWAYKRKVFYTILKCLRTLLQLNRSLIFKEKIMVRYFLLFLLLFSLFTLSGCESEKEVDQIISDYVKKEYSIDSMIIEREGVNEGNMGERTFVLESKEENPVKFEVYLEGMFSTTVTGDNYKEQKEARKAGSEFSSKNKEVLTSNGFRDIEFYTTQGDLVVTAISDNDINLFDGNSLNRLLQLGQLLEKSEPSIDWVDLKTKSIEDLVYFQLFDLKDEEQLKKKLLTNPDVLNVSLFQRDYKKFKAIEEEIVKKGYKLKNGLTVGRDDQTFYCFEDNEKNGECPGGYYFEIIGKSDKESIFEIVSFLKSQPIPIDGFTVLPEDIYLENLENIISPDQIVTEENR